MKWRQVDAYHWERECQRYTVDVVRVCGAERWTAWRRTEKRDGMPTNLGCFDSREAAIGACSADLAKQRAAA